MERPENPLKTISHWMAKVNHHLATGPHGMASEVRKDLDADVQKLQAAAAEYEKHLLDEDDEVVTGAPVAPAAEAGGAVAPAAEAGGAVAPAAEAGGAVETGKQDAPVQDEKKA